jgi:phosphohistidine phosphatase
VERPELDYSQPPEAVVRWLAQGPAEDLVVAVGHEPQLGLLAGLLLAGIARPLVVFRKGGVALLECPGRARAGEAVLHWALTPSQLRGLKQE